MLLTTEAEKSQSDFKEVGIRKLVHDHWTMAELAFEFVVTIVACTKLDVGSMLDSKQLF